MNFEFSQTSLKSVTQQRNIAYLCCTGLTLAVIILSIAVLRKEEKWILMPQFNDEHHLEVTRSKFSEQYLVDWADGIVNTIKCVNPDSIDWKVHQILKISISHGVLQKQLETEAKKIKTDRVSTAFYPSSYQVEQDKGYVIVKGKHSVWFGTDKAPILSDKIYKLSWKQVKNGAILLENFIDVTNGEKK